MDITIYRHESYNKFLVSVEKGFVVNKITVYDMSVKELGEFIGALIKADEDK